MEFNKLVKLLNNAYTKSKFKIVVYQKRSLSFETIKSSLKTKNTSLRPTYFYIFKYKINQYVQSFYKKSNIISALTLFGVILYKNY